MKMVGLKRKQFFLLWWLGITVQLCFILGSCSEKTLVRRGLRQTNRLEAACSGSAVKLTDNGQQVVIDNGVVSVILSKPEGNVLGVSYKGIDNLLEAHNEQDDRGYLDVVWSEPQMAGQFQRIQGTKFSVIAADENQVEVSFLIIWTSSMRGLSVPINIDKRYIMRKCDSGFYSYIIFERTEEMPAVVVDQVRIVFKLSNDIFHYMAISDTRQRTMPSLEDRARGQQLAYPEAILLTNPSNPELKGEVDDKYQYSCENKDNSVHGWINFDSNRSVGVWMITPSNEFRNAGPVKQDLTSHVGPTMLSMFTSNHYGGKGVNMAFQKGETYNKVFGPVFVYLNSHPIGNDPKPLWIDAVQQMSKEANSWPYDFPRSQDFARTNQRGKISGQLQVQDGGGRIQYANSSHIGLALPGDPGSWQTESKGYQFWTQADKNGYFEINNAVPGDYNLYAWIDGFIGDYKYINTITISPGSDIKLGQLVYRPPRNGPTLWEIGYPDRSAAEFFIPDPYPTLMNKLFKKDPADKFRQYGLWSRYADLYPRHDLVYRVGVDTNKDWFFAHVTRNTGNKTYEATTWQISFELVHQIDTSRGNYTLQLALAAATNARLQVLFNDAGASPPHFTTGLIGDDNAIARHGIHGLYWLFSIDVPANLLVRGNNTIYLTQSEARSPFEGVMYDYIRLEGPPAAGI